jgi:hypothetical protein
MTNLEKFIARALIAAEVRKQRRLMTLKARSK